MRVPALRFSGFTDAWQHKCLGELFKISSGTTPSRAVKDYFVGGKHFWVKTTDLNNGIIIDTQEKVTDLALQQTSLKVYPKDSILIAMYGGFNQIGRTGLLAVDAAVNQALSVLSPNRQQINPYFLLSYLNYHIEDWKQFAASSRKDPNITKSDVIQFRLSYPSLSEQTKLANFLKAIDEKIVQLTRKCELLAHYKKGVMQQIFSQKLRFKDDDGQNFPQWEIKTLGEIGSFQTSSIDKLSKDNESEVYLVNYMNVYRHEKINNQTINSFQVVTAKDTQIKSCNLKKGDILFTPSSETPDDIGHSAVIFEDLENAVFSYHLIRFRPKQNIDILYSHYFCNVPDVLSQLSKLATGSTRFTVSVKSFSSVIVSLPCLAEQVKIANFLSAIDQKLTHTQNQLAAAKQYKQGLLQQMFV